MVDFSSALMASLRRLLIILAQKLISTYACVHVFVASIDHTGWTAGFITITKSLFNNTHTYTRTHTHTLVCTCFKCVVCLNEITLST